MSRLRAMAARLRAASVYVQLCLMACRDRLVRLLLLLPVMLLPHTAMANTLFDMIKTVGDGARGSSSSFVAAAMHCAPLKRRMLANFLCGAFVFLTEIRRRRQ